MTLCPYVKTYDCLRRDTPSLNAISTVGVSRFVPLFLLPTQGVFSGFAFVWFHHSSSLKKLVEVREGIEEYFEFLRSWVSIA
jgi:hypothetical protein